MKCFQKKRFRVEGTFINIPCMPNANISFTGYKIFTITIAMNKRKSFSENQNYRYTPAVQAKYVSFGYISWDRDDRYVFSRPRPFASATSVKNEGILPFLEVAIESAPGLVYRVNPASASIANKYNLLIMHIS